MNACPHWREVEALRFARSNHRDSAHPVVIAGAGPIGLTLAIDLAQRGVPSVVLEQDDRLSDGSRALCWSRRTLDIFTRIGIGDAVRDTGVQWQVGRVFHRQNEIYRQRLTPDAFPENPFFVNLQQPLCEYLLLEQCKQHADIDLRWGNKLIDARHREDDDGDGVTVTVQCDQRDYRIDADYLIACDGAKSTVRRRLGLRFEGEVFNDRFLIADIEMAGDFPGERRFWFEPPFHDGQSTLLHKQAQGIWRVDFQLNTAHGAAADVSEAQLRLDRDEDAVRKRIRAFLGPDGPDFDIVWRSVYVFTCRRIERFRHRNMLFAGDSAHVVSPFGARGGNGGVQDSDNLGWKLAEVIHGRAGDALLDGYHAERAAAADEDILNAARTTDFMTPKTQKSKRIRDRVLRLARAHDFARRMVNAGRMSRAFSYRDFAPFADHPDGARVHAGDAGLDMPLVNAHSGAPSYLLRHIRDYSVAVYQRPRFERRGRGAACHVIHIGDGATDDWRDTQGLMREHYVGDGDNGNGDNGDNNGGYILFRPDQHILGVWRDREPNAMLDALAQQRAP
ncbi:MAG: FAD-dependent monooxygenase [Gammaproteobacteria bacterium]|nr:FAD-dependent monooxygenase [Gammaproteobacteria bacterium]